MKKAIKYIKAVDKDDDFGVYESDAYEAIRLAYNEAVEDCLLKVSDYCESEMIDKRDIVMRLKKLKQ